MPRQDWRVENASRMRARRKLLKSALLEKFGSVCACCGESNPMFLTLDHKNGNGKEHRETLKPEQIQRYALNGKLPAEDFQTLCFNCNCGRSLNGGVCPHRA